MYSNSSESTCSECAAWVPDGGEGLLHHIDRLPTTRPTLLLQTREERPTCDLVSCVIMYVIIGPRTSSSVGYETGGDGV